MGVASADLDLYRRDGEEFVSRLDQAYYLHYAGHSAALPIAALYERFGHLFTAEAAADLTAAAAEARGDARRSLSSLALFAADGYLGQAVRRQTEALAAREAEATIRVEGETVGYRAAAALLANEPDRLRRARIEEERLRVVSEELNPLHHEIWSTLHDLARDLGADSYRALYEGLKGVDFEALRTQAERLLAETDELHVAALDRQLRSSLGLGIDDAARADLPALLRASGYDRHFPADRMVWALEQTLEGLGIDLRGQSSIVLDTEARPMKSPRAFCAPVRVPDEVYLVVAPTGGLDDYRALFHEAGHAEHFAGTSRGLPFEFRYLGDNAVTEAYAFLLEGLTHDPVWLAQVLGYREADEYLRHIATTRLYMHRRYAAKLGYEMALHGGGRLEGQERRYADALTEAVRIPWPRETYLADVDEGFYAVNYIRAWALELSLRDLLRERYGTRWFASPRAGGFLRELWNEGQRLNADELARELDLPGIELSALTADAHMVLGR